MNGDEVRDNHYYDLKLAKIVSAEKYFNTHNNGELIIEKDKKKVFLYEQDKMPFKDDNKSLVIERNKELVSRVVKFIDFFNSWSATSNLTKDEEQFSFMFDERNPYNLYGLNFESNRYYELRSSYYRPGTDDYIYNYPNYEQSKLLFYFDEKENKYKVMFIFTTRVSSLLLDDADNFHTIVLRMDLEYAITNKKDYVDFFYSMVSLIKGVNIYTDEKEYKEIMDNHMTIE